MYFSLGLWFHISEEQNLLIKKMSAAKPGLFIFNII